MKIGNVDLGQRPLLLAPMEDVSDAPFRLLCKQFGASLVYTEFVSADALVRYVPSTCKKMQIATEERPAAIQIYGRDVDTMREAARMACELKPDILDLNFGCPVKRVAGKGAGSGMLRDIPKLLQITKAVVEVSDCPVTVKTRLGWDHNSIIIEDLALALQDCGIAALTIHGRTRSDMYKGKADWTLIGRIKDNQQMHIPIIGNGDITTGEEALSAFEQYGVDAVMVGRASVGQPWIFSEMQTTLKSNTIQNISLTLSGKMKILRQIVESNIQKLDPYKGILHSRRHLAATPLFKGIPNFRSTRIEMLQASDPETLFSVLNKVEEMLLESTNLPL